MTSTRFPYQRAQAENTTGIVLNIGCYDDPAEIKSVDPSRVLNCDINKYEGFAEVDVVMDIRETWPFSDASVELVILGDIIEHLFYPEALESLTEARRVSQKLCITVPEDTRHEGTEVYEQDEAGARPHCYTWTEERLKKLLSETGWTVQDWQEVNYDFVPRGFFVLAV